MIYEKSYVESFLAGFVRPKRSDLEAPLLDVFDALKSGTVVSPQTLIALVDAASDRHTTVYEVSTEFLGEVAERDGVALEMIQNMAVSMHAHVRHNALLCLTANTPSKVCINMISNGLKDKSSRVRRKAADWALRLCLRDVELELSQAFKRESHLATAAVMRAALTVLRTK